MRDELLELVMNKASGRASEQDLHRIDSILELEPHLWDDYNQWHREIPALRDSMCFAAAIAEARHQLPEHIRKELRARMRAAIPRIQPNYGQLMELVNKPPNPRPSWRWAVAPAVGLAAIVVISLVLFNNRPETEAPAKSEVANNQPTTPVAPAAPTAPVIQVALLNIMGATRGSEDTTLNQFQTAWPKVQVQQFSRSATSKDWLTQWPVTTNGPVCKIFYNQSSGELQLIAIVDKQKYETSFELNEASELPQLIERAKTQLDEWLM